MSERIPAKLDGDYVRDANWRIMKKTRKQWERYAERLAKKQSAKDGITWQVSLFDARKWGFGDYIRINFFYEYGEDK